MKKMNAYSLGAIALAVSVIFPPSTSNAMEFRGVKTSQSTVVFMVCDASRVCSPVGSANGYAVSRLRFSPTLRKIGAIALGTGEVAVAAAGTVFMAPGGTMILTGALTAPVGTATVAVKAAGALFGAGLVVAPTAITVSAASIFDSLNPVYHWRKANIERQLTISAIKEGRPLVIEFRDEKTLLSFIESVADILSSIRPETSPSGIAFPIRLTPVDAVPALR